VVIARVYTGLPGPAKRRRFPLIGNTQSPEAAHRRSLGREPRPRILIVGGEDVHRRLDLMHSLADRFHFAAAGSEMELSRDFTAAGIPYFYYPLDRGINPLQDARTFFFLGRLIRRLQPDVVHAFATKPAVWGRLAARWAGAPRVIGTLPGLGALYSRDDLKTRLIRGLYQPLQRRACYASDLTIFQNQEDLNQFVQLGVTPADRSVVIPGSGVRTEVMDPRRARPEAARAFREEVGAAEHDVVVTMISRLLRSKGVREFAEVARRFSGEGLPATFVLVGPHDPEGWDSVSGEEIARVRASVRWLGERSDVRPIYAGSDVFVLPSRYREGMPRVLLEAASMGLPLVATRNPGSVAAVDHGRNGFLVESNEPDALADTIRTLVTQPLLRRRFAGESRKTALERFDLGVITEATADKYDELLRASGHPIGRVPHSGVEPRAQPGGSVSA